MITVGTSATRQTQYIINWAQEYNITLYEKKRTHDNYMQLTVTAQRRALIQCETQLKLHNNQR